uniref:Centrosome-associated zinc finger protein CP190 n=1 Tax=Timema douglasi TaxID=61478 RepID=A0A7R8Z568_TIMDO|nr:unnamed protein product [Timema douglasi]
MDIIGSVKQVKVDNWGVFFLQRLQTFHSKGDFCDLILQFHSNECVKVHRLVLSACTEYFQMLERAGNLEGDTLLMPADMKSQVVLPIINFMYTGRLEYRIELQDRLYSTAKQMNMMVLTKLLDAQAAAQIAQPRAAAQTAPPRAAMNKSSSQIHHVAVPVKKYGQPKVVDPNLPETLPGRKLPIWKRRSVPTSKPSGSDYFSSPYSNEFDMSSRSSDEPRPTRFEWPDADTSILAPMTFTSAFDNLSYETPPIIKASKTDIRSSTAPINMSYPTTSKASTFEDIKRNVVTKRPASMMLANDNNAKKAKMMDLQAVKEYVQEAKLRNDLLDSNDDDEEVDDDLALADFDDDDDEEEERIVSISAEEDSYTFNKSSVLANSTPHKSILKPQTSTQEEEPHASPIIASSKKVRFSFDTSSAEEKENAANKVKLVSKEVTQQPVVSRPQSTAMNTLSNSGNVSNHAKIISEVLKKYPNLVKKNKNIKLKIMHRGGLPTSSVPSDGDPKTQKPKVSYVMLKSDMAGKGKVSMKHGGQVETFIQGLSSGETKPVSGAENTTGPWLCHSCGTNEEPINFSSYYLYRHHLQDVHMEKIDARICEHCGHRASKRNLLLYHLYTKHGVFPPRNCQFPRCDQCDYVALSESLLIKHRNNHLNNKEFTCKVCAATFKSNGALQGHMQTNLHSNNLSKKLYECPFCLKPFVRNINLKAHIRSIHKDNAKNLSEELVDDEDEAHSLDIMENINAHETITEVPLIDTVKGGNMSLPPGVTLLAEVPAAPSSEAEALNNVASGIATSLGLAESSSGDQTVIVLDDSQEYYLHTTEVTDDNVNDIQECVVDNLGNHVRENQEFIVPEIMAGEEQQYGGLTAYTTPDGQTVVVSQAGVVTTCPTVMAPPINTSSGGVTMILSDHNYVEEGSFRAGSVPEGMMIYITQPATGELGVLQQQIPVTLSDVAENSSVLIAQPKANQMVVMSSDDKPQNELCEDVAVTKTDLVREVVSQEMVVNVQAMKNCIQEKILVEVQSDKRREEFEHGSNISMSNMPSLDEDVLIQPSESPDQSLNNDMREIEEDGNCREMLEEAEEGTSGVGAQVSTPVICRRPFVEMEELVRDWDDFDEEGEVLPETEGEKNEHSEGAQVLRTMKTEISDSVPRLVKHEQEET